MERGRARLHPLFLTIVVHVCIHGLSQAIVYVDEKTMAERNKQNLYMGLESHQNFLESTRIEHTHIL